MPDSRLREPGMALETLAIVADIRDDPDQPVIGHNHSHHAPADLIRREEPSGMTS
jgi:hypothetical protein